MAILRLTLRSQALRASTDVNIIYPLRRQTFGDPEGRKVTYAPIPDKFKVLYLVHGGGDNYSDWLTRTRIADLAEARDLLVVMPSIRDFTSSRADADYYAYLSQELPAYLQRMLPISNRREDTFIAGLSMGGYFSYRIALNHPERYACAGSLSSPLDIVADLRARHTGSRTLVPADSLIGTDREIRFLVERNLAQGNPMPRLFSACGTEDFTYEINCDMRDFFRAKGLDHTYMEGPGVHNWDFWSAYIESLLEWLPVEKLPEAPHHFQKRGK